MAERETDEQRAERLSEGWPDMFALRAAILEAQRLARQDEQEQACKRVAESMGERCIYYADVVAAIRSRQPGGAKP